MDDGGRSPGTGGRTGVTCGLTFSQHPPEPPSVCVSIHRSAHWGWPRGCPPSPFSPVESSGSPGWGVTLEPGGRLQHKSRSSLLSRTPVRGEYSIAPKLRAEAESGLPARHGCPSPSCLRQPASTPEPPLAPKDPPVPPIRVSFWVKLMPKQVLAPGHPSAASQPEKPEVDGPSDREEEAKGKARYCPMDTSKGTPGARQTS